MASMRHECLVDLFRNRPSLAAEMLVEVLSVVLPPYSEARVVSIDLTETQPAGRRAASPDPSRPGSPRGAEEAA